MSGLLKDLWIVHIFPHVELYDLAALIKTCSFFKKLISGSERYTRWRYLMMHGHNSSICYYAAFYNEIRLLKRFGNEALYMKIRGACKAGNLDLVKSILEKITDGLERRCVTSMFPACSASQWHIADYLEQFITDDYSSAIEGCCVSGNIPRLERYLAKCNMNRCQSYAESYIVEAVTSQNYDVVRLIQTRFKPNLGKVIKILAVDKEHLEGLKFIIETFGASELTVGKCYVKALEQGKPSEISDYLLSLSSNFN